MSIYDSARSRRPGFRCCYQKKVWISHRKASRWFLLKISAFASWKMGPKVPRNRKRWTCY